MNQYVDGVGQLADGSQQSRTARARRPRCANKLEQGAVDLNTGIAKLSTGSVAVTQGTRDVANGLGVLGASTGRDSELGKVPPAWRRAAPRSRTG